MPEEMDPRVLFAMTLISLGVAGVKQIIDLWRRSGVDEDVLAKIQVEADTRLAQWQALV